MSGSWTALAEQVAADLPEPGFAAAVIAARAWAARADPEATGGLLGAAVTLAGEGALAVLYKRGHAPLKDDRELLARCDDLESRIADLLIATRRMHQACAAELDAAHEALAEAQAAKAAAQAYLARAATDEAVTTAMAAIAAADAAIAGAEMQIADCEVALEILGDVLQRLAHALKCARAVPADLEATYEAPYQLVRDGGQLPLSGDFLTGSRDAA